MFLVQPEARHEDCGSVHRMVGRSPCSTTEPTSQETTLKIFCWIGFHHWDDKNAHLMKCIRPGCDAVYNNCHSLFQ